MYQIDFKHPCHVYFIGIGGISMSGFARLLHDCGFTVCGSDLNRSRITSHLESLGISIVYGQASANITKDIDFVVYTAAIHPSNPEFQKAKELGIPMMERAQMVGQVMQNYKNAIAVAGTHGKTTTTSMLSHIFLEAEKDPTISVGGILKAINGNIRIGHSENFITEACEYTNSFLKFFPTAAAILNIEADHLDFFKDIDDIRHSFRQFASLLPEDGVLVAGSDIEQLDTVTEQLKAPLVTTGLTPNGSADSQSGSSASPVCHYQAVGITFHEQGFAHFELICQPYRDVPWENLHEGDAAVSLGSVSLHVGGMHNVSNALAAIALARFFHIDMETICRGLLAFEGTQRRFEQKGSFNGVTVVDDYAHHPTEIKATLATAQKFPHNHLWCVFQPHTYSRTKALLDDFAESLALAENVILTDIYAAREPDPGDISSRDLQQKIIERGKNAYYISSFEEVEKFLLKKCIDGDLLITMGAGNVVNIGEDLVQK